MKRTLRYRYPTARRSPEITEGVELEIGSRGGPTPNSDVELRSYVASFATGFAGVEPDEYEEISGFTAHVLGPERTLVEKMALLAADVHTRSVRAGWPSIERPTAGWSTCSALTSRGTATGHLERAFAAARPLVYGTFPTFDECLQRIADSPQRI